MTHRQLYLQAKQALAQAGVDSPGSDAMALLSHFFGLDRPGLALHGEETPSQEKAAAFLQAVEERAARRPLQYILGAWDFMGLTLAVGEGVLCPREDTAVLVHALAGLLQDAPAPQGLDLCAGTGAVGLGLCSLLPQAQVTALELSPLALRYLEENTAAYPQYQVTPHRGDVLSPATAARFPRHSLDFWPPTPPTSPGRSCPPSSPRCRKSPPWPWTAARTASGSTGPSPGCGCPSSSPAPPSPWRSARPRPSRSAPSSAPTAPPPSASTRTSPAWTAVFLGGWPRRTGKSLHKKRSGILVRNREPNFNLLGPSFTFAKPARTGQESPSTKGVPGF